MPLQDTVPAEPWKIWPDGVIPAEGGLPELRLRSPRQGQAWLRKLAELRSGCRLPNGASSLELVRWERDGH